MRYLILLSCFIFTLIGFNSSVSYGFSYDIDRYTQVGGVSGSSTFVDEFNDGIEPPDGPSGASTYTLEGGATFSSNRESGGLLELNSDDFAIDPNDFWINAELDDSTYYFIDGAGGSITGRFEINNGFSPNTYFGIGMNNIDPIFNDPSGEAWVEIGIDSLGNKTAFWGNDFSEGSQDITAALGANTDITMTISMNTSNQLTAMWDFGSDGSADMTKVNFQTVIFLSGYNYSGSFEVGAGLPVPEPTTIALLGIGLAGFAGVAVRRRLKKQYSNTRKLKYVKKVERQ